MINSKLQNDSFFLTWNKPLSKKMAHFLLLQTEIICLCMLISSHTIFHFQRYLTTFLYSCSDKSRISNQVLNDQSFSPISISKPSKMHLSKDSHPAHTIMRFRIKSVSKSLRNSSCVLYRDKRQNNPNTWFLSFL